jgi:hypothetical protein
MSWKKTPPFFAWQTLKFAEDLAHFRLMWTYYGQWLSSFRAGRSSVQDEWPWINFPALEVLMHAVKPGFKVFEFGGGGSTLFFCKRGAEVVTVEDHTQWFQTLTEKIAASGYPHWQGHLVEPEALPPGTPEPDFKDPDAYASAAKGMRQFSFERYAKTITQYPEVYFDIILVDGRARPSCIKQAIPHLKPGGLLVVDNTERDYYLAPFRALLNETFIPVIGQRAPVPYTPDFTVTSIFRKK